MKDNMFCFQYIIQKIVFMSKPVSQLLLFCDIVLHKKAAVNLIFTTAFIFPSLLYTNLYIVVDLYAFVGPYTTDGKFGL